MSKQPEALGFAICLESRGYQAEAEELRRLHTENERLRAALEQPQGDQEPVVAWWCSTIEKHADGSFGVIRAFFSKEPAGDVSQPLYTHQQPKLDPLTNEQEEVAFEEFWYEHTMETFPKDYDMSRFSIWGEKYKPYARKAWFARASIERAHGIK